MRVVELSSHSGDILGDPAEQQDRRQAAERQLLSVYDDELVRYRARVESAKVARDRARAGHRWRPWLRLSVTAWREGHRVPRPPVPSAGHAPYGHRDLEVKTMATELGRILDDRWTLLRGYRNQCGEIDHVLLGPRGLFAIEYAPGVRIDEPAAGLERLLAQRGYPAEVSRVGPGASAGDVLDLVQASARRLDEKQRAAISDLIQRDHARQD